MQCLSDDLSVSIASIEKLDCRFNICIAKRERRQYKGVESRVQLFDLQNPPCQQDAPSSQHIAIALLWYPASCTVGAFFLRY